MDNPENVGSRNSYSRINDCMNLSNLRFSKKSQGLETSQNSKTTNTSGFPTKNWPKSPTGVQEQDPPLYSVLSQLNPVNISSVS
jgi:hypothetical protein